MVDNEVIRAHAYRAVLDDRIAELWRYRAWWRSHRWAEHPLRRIETDIELRALVRLARKARDLARPAVREAVSIPFDFPVDMTVARLDAEWTESELRLAHGDH